MINHDEKAVKLKLRIEAGSDFADLFEVKDALSKQGSYSQSVRDGALVLRYQRDTFQRETVITPSKPARIDKGGITFTVPLQPKARWDGRGERRDRRGVAHERRSLNRDHAARKRRNMERDLDRWIAKAPKLECDWDSLKSTYRRSLVDLAALRFSPLIAGGASLPAAGLPWFMAMFGRDSLFTSLQALPFAPELAATTLRALARGRARAVDDFRDEEPGQILHEMRYGELTAFEERPHSPYYGTADATPLFVVLLDEYERWTGDARLVRELEREARAALDWIDEYGDLHGDGYVEYQRRNERDRPREPVLEGLVGLDLLPRRHACPASRGRPASCRATPTTPRCAAPGWPARSGTTPAYAERLETRGGRPQAALQPRLLGRRPRLLRARARRRRQARSTRSRSNIGHLLWSGIVDATKAAARRRAPDGADALLGLGRPHDGRGRGRATTRSATTSARSGRTTTRSSPGACAATATRRRRRGSPSASCEAAELLRRAAARGVRRLRRARSPATRSSTRPRAARRPGRRARRCCCCARCSGSSRGEHLVVDPALPDGVGRIELLDIPGRWGRIDAFGRGMVDVGRR